MHVNEKCDVYSFGVVALETMMGRHPGDLLSTLKSFQSAQRNILLEVLDLRLPRPTNKQEQDIILVLNLALACLSSDQKLRPTMLAVSREFLSEKGVTSLTKSIKDTEKSTELYKRWEDICCESDTSSE